MNRISYIILTIVISAVAYFCTIGFGRWKQRIADNAVSEAMAHHQQGITHSVEANVHAIQGGITLTQAYSLQERLDAENKEVVRLKALLAKKPPPVVVGQSFPVDPTLDIRDELIATQTAEISTLKLQNELYKRSTSMYKVSYENMKEAYEKERTSHELDNIAHKASLAAARAGKWKVGMVSFGGGILLGTGLGVGLKH